MKKRLLGVALAVLASATAANATVVWTDWTSGTTGTTSGSATGTMGGVTVTYTGEMEALNPDVSNWSPASTWQGGPVTNAPSGQSGIQLFGGPNTATDTLTFSTAVLNPVLAIVSLGNSGNTSSFNFTTSSFTVLGGGPSTEWGGGAITRTGNNVFGSEGNGLVEFNGLVQSISWTNPTMEDYYAFTVGEVGAVPEPSTWLMMIAGFLGLGLMTYRKKAALRLA